MSLLPRFTLSDMFGEDASMLCVPAVEPYGFVSPHGAGWEWIGRMASRLPFAGSLPVFCHESLLQKHWFAFHRDAGLPTVMHPLPYRDRKDLQSQLDTMTRHPRSLVLDYLYPPGMIPENAHYVERALVASLNNKADLEQWAGTVPIPPRHTVFREDLHLHLQRIFSNGHSVYLKGASDGPSGAGNGVRHAATPEEAHRHARAFAACPRIVVEQSRPYTTTFCFNYLIFSANHIQYLGAGEQLIKNHAVYAGNWFDPDRPPPPGAVEDGMRIAQRAAAAGYVGIAGMDAGLLPDGGWEFLDLNFRTNGSTPALLFLPAVYRHLMHLPVARACRLAPAALDANALLFLLRQIDLGHLFVLGAYSPAIPTIERGRVNLLVVGADRHQVEERVQNVEKVLGSTGE